LTVVGANSNYVFFRFESHDHVQRSQANKTADEISRERAGVEPEKKNGHTSSHNLDPVSHTV
jgi:hypothetical protein